MWNLTAPTSPGDLPDENKRAIISAKKWSCILRRLFKESLAEKPWNSTAMYARIDCDPLMSSDGQIPIYIPYPRQSIWLYWGSQTCTGIRFGGVTAARTQTGDALSSLNTSQINIYWRDPPRVRDPHSNAAQVLYCVARLVLFPQSTAHFTRPIALPPLSLRFEKCSQWQHQSQWEEIPLRWRKNTIGLLG